MCAGRHLASISDVQSVEDHEEAADQLDESGEYHRYCRSLETVAGD